MSGASPLPRIPSGSWYDTVPDADLDAAEAEVAADVERTGRSWREQLVKDYRRRSQVAVEQCIRLGAPSASTLGRLRALAVLVDDERSTPHDAA